MGLTNSCGQCPVARALQRETGKMCRVFEGVASIDQQIIVLPPNVVEFLRALDSGEPVKPIEFIIAYGSTPWMSHEEVTTVIRNIERFEIDEEELTSSLQRRIKCVK